MSSPGIRPTRGRHRKRISALRLSSDSTVTTLPPYTSPPWSRHASLDVSDSDKPPDYPDSAEEADADTDTDEDNVVYVQPPLPKLSLSQGTRIRRPHSQLQSPRSHSHSHSNSFSHSHSHSLRRQQSAAGSGNDDPYLDSLLARSVHALEMSNTLLQSSMSTQSSLSAVLQNDPMADLSLEARAQMLSRRVYSNRNVHESWVDGLDEIYRSVEDLVGREEDEGEGEGEDGEAARRSKVDMQSLSKSAPASSFEDHFRKGAPVVGAEERVQARRRPSLRRPSLDSMGGSHLEYSNHDRSHFVAPAPRALTIYVDSTDDPALIKLPSTLGLRTSSHLVPAPLPSQMTAIDTGREASVKPSDSAKSLVDVLSSYVASPPATGPSGSVSSSPRFSIMTRSGRSSSTSSSSKTVRRVRQSKSPPAATTSPTSFRSRSLTPMRTATPPRAPRPMTPPIEELSASSSSSSSSETLHVDRTLESLRTILGKQPPPAHSPGSSKSTPLPLPKPSLLSPPTVEPVSSTSNATASVSRLFTKNRHSSSTRPPSPPRQSVLKNRSAPPTPTLSAPPTRSPSTAGVSGPETFAGLHLGMPSVPGLRSASATSSGRSTPKRISFAELPESYAGSKPDGAPSRFRDKLKGKERAKGRGRGRGKEKGKGKGKEEEDAGWWTGWLLGAAGTGSGAGLSMSAAREERMRGPGWTTRPGYVGGSWEEWGA